ncbi:hypothetical protein DPMN_045106 [Dreissena polymorpha]|uniref:Uncharacterized protein n=1 Tax=Dreissena polymorpha TaxID=45954 RepID=A0A9D4HZK3_DREPO|nr:hypothetical protein DPMN_045106 [Dreissena polymorpha]
MTVSEILCVGIETLQLEETYCMGGWMGVGGLAGLGWVGGWMDGWVSGFWWVGEWVWVDGWGLGDWMDGLDGWVSGWVDEWMGG